MIHTIGVIFLGCLITLSPLLILMWFTRKYTKVGIYMPKCPRQLCKNYQDKCGVCCRQVRFDMFEVRK